MSRIELSANFALHIDRDTSHGGSPVVYFRLVHTDTRNGAEKVCSGFHIFEDKVPELQRAVAALTRNPYSSLPADGDR